MTFETMYSDLKDLAERMGIAVYEKNLRQVGTRIKSGFCIVKGEHLFIMDKHKSTRDKIRILATHLSMSPHEDIYIMPALRKIIDSHRSVEIARENEKGEAEGDPGSNTP